MLDDAGRYSGRREGKELTMFASYYNSRLGRLRFAAPYTLVGVGGGVLALLGLLLFIPALVALAVPENYFISPETLCNISGNLKSAGIKMVGCGFTLILIAYIIYKKTPDSKKIRHMIWRGLCCPAYANPLHLKDGEFLPKVSCVRVSSGRFHVTITGASIDPEDVAKLSGRISSLIGGKYHRFGVLYTECAPDHSETMFCIEDLAPDRGITFKSLNEMGNYDPTKIILQNGTALDLTACGSILVSGRTRSGKTTAVLYLLLQTLLQGRDDHGSEVMVIDPKMAELSRLPHVLTLDKDGGARGIMSGIRHFAEGIARRQSFLNDLSERLGNAILWHQAGLRPSFLFIDEYVSLRTILPKKADKSDPDYSLADFDELLTRIVTMGASAGCFVILSIAQASVAEGGLPSMLRSAMATKILFRPTLEEGRFLWPSSALEPLALARKYTAGDSWFSSADGVNDNPGYVRFPHMEFPAYRELGRLLSEYYDN